MPHTDKFGRFWTFAPAHNTNDMVRIPTPIMERFISADRLMRGPWDKLNYFEGSKVECYVLRMQSGVYTGARFGNEGPDYYSSLIHDNRNVIRLLQYMRERECSDLPNMRALLALFPNEDSLEQ